MNCRQFTKFTLKMVLSGGNDGKLTSSSKSTSLKWCITILCLMVCIYLDCQDLIAISRKWNIINLTNKTHLLVGSLYQQCSPIPNFSHCSIKKKQFTNTVTPSSTEIITVIRLFGFPFQEGLCIKFQRIQLHVKIKKQS